LIRRDDGALPGVGALEIGTELASVGAYGGFFEIALGSGDDGYWRPITAVYSDGCADLIAATARNYRTSDLRIAASLVQMSLASRLWSPALACALRFGVVPDFTDLQRAENSADLRLPNPTGERIDDEDRLAASLYDVIVQRNLEPLAAGLRVKIAPGLLYGNIASAMVAATRALYTLQPNLRDRATKLARALLETQRLAGTGTVKYNLAFRRRSCCLYYRVADGATCGDCALINRRR
jgi:hypothetical protein